MYLELIAVSFLVTSIIDIIEGAPATFNNMEQESHITRKSREDNPYKHNNSPVNVENSEVNTKDSPSIDIEAIEQTDSVINTYPQIYREGGRQRRWLGSRRVSVYDRSGDISIIGTARRHNTRHGNKKRNRNRNRATNTDNNWDYSPYGGGVFGRKKREAPSIYEYDY